MKAEMSVGGMITLTAETGIESFALNAWHVKSAHIIAPAPDMRGEVQYYRGTSLMIVTLPEFAVT